MGAVALFTSALFVCSCVSAKSEKNGQENPAENASAEAAAASQSISGVKAVTTIAESFGDGEKVSAVVVEYEDPIDAESVSAASYTVEGRSIESVFTNSAAATGFSPKKRTTE